MQCAILVNYDYFASGSSATRYLVATVTPLECTEAVESHMSIDGAVRAQLATYIQSRLDVGTPTQRGGLRPLQAEHHQDQVIGVSSIKDLFIVYG